MHWPVSSWMLQMPWHQILVLVPGHQQPVASFTKEVNPRLVKRPLKTNRRLANRGLTSLVKEAIGCCLLYSKPFPKPMSQPSHLYSGSSFAWKDGLYIEQGSTLSFLAGCPKSHFLDCYRNFLVYSYLKLDNQVINSTCPKDKLGWIWRADDP